jgi:putative copper resistance protein D
MFARRRIESGNEAPTHVEFLIDRQGYLRARWIGIRDAAKTQAAEMLAQIELLNREPPGAPPAEGHGH